MKIEKDSFVPSKNYNTVANKTPLKSSVNNIYMNLALRPRICPTDTDAAHKAMRMLRQLHRWHGNSIETAPTVTYFH